MLGKLMKYELKACSRIFIPIYVGILAVSTAMGISMNAKIANKVGSLLNVKVILIILLTSLFIGLAVTTIILIIQRFKNNLLQDEGYLMFTLPVSTKNIILSKFLVSLIFILCSTIIAILAFMIIGVLSGEFNISNIIKEICTVDGIDINTFQFVAIILLFFLASYSIFILSVYFSLSIGQFPQLSKHKTIVGLAAFFIINTIISYIQVGLNYYFVSDKIFNEVTVGILLNLTAADIIIIISHIAIAVALFFSIDWILNRKLNLE